MFQDLDKTLEQLLTRELPPIVLESASLSFIAPDGEFPPATVTLPSINLFLYDIHENMELRSSEWRQERRTDGTVLQQRAPVRVDCSYLITAWPSDASPHPAVDEHRMLGEVLKVLIRHPVLPDAFLFGSLAKQEPKLPAITIHQSQLQSWGDFWQAIGSKPKAALQYTVTISVPVGEPVETGGIVRDKTINFKRKNDEVMTR
jgi:hypothetical protein